MQNVSGVVHTRLEGTIRVRVDGSATAEAHAFAKVVPSFLAIAAGATIHASFYRNALTNGEAGDTCADGGNNSSSFMAKDERCAHSEVTVATVHIVVNYKLCEALPAGKLKLNVRSLPQRPVEATATWTWVGAGGQRVRFSMRRFLGPWRTAAFCEGRATGDIVGSCEKRVNVAGPSCRYK